MSHKIVFICILLGSAIGSSVAVFSQPQSLESALISGIKYETKAIRSPKYAHLYGLSLLVENALFKTEFVRENEEDSKTPYPLPPDHEENLAIPLGPEDTSLRVILAPYQKTVLSAQISTPILSSQVSAPVTNIYFRMGESFKKNDILMRLDETVFKANVEKAKAVLRRAQAILSAKTNLYHDKVASYVELKDAEAATATADAEVVLALNQYDAAIIVAPYDGKVISLNIELYELPQPGQALIEILEDDLLLAKILVPSTFLKDIYIGKMLKINIKETETTVDAKIIRIGAVIDPASSTIAVEAEINNHDGTLKAGMIGTTYITGDNS